MMDARVLFWEIMDFWEQWPKELLAIIDWNQNSWITLRIQMVVETIFWGNYGFLGALTDGSRQDQLWETIARLIAAKSLVRYMYVYYTYI